MAEENQNKKEENQNEKREEQNERKEEHNHLNQNHNQHFKHKHHHNSNQNFNHPINHNNNNNSEHNHSSNKSFIKKIKKELTSNYWAILTIILAVVILFMFFNPMTTTSGAIGEKKAGEIVLNFAQVQGITAELVNVSFANGLYKVTVIIQGQDVPVYLTSDGKNLVPSIIPIATILAQASQTNDSQQPAPTEVPKSDKPTTELFVMTHCPYGTQAEKGIIPVIEKMGNNANIKIRFVDYTMHGEKEDTETRVQVCIREEQSAKYIPYLKEFLKASDTEAAKSAAGINEVALEECISSGKGEEYYAEDSALSKQYGVKGSPTLVINGVQSNAGRAPSSYLTGICSAYNNAPVACNSTLSTETPSAGFGYNAGSDSAAAAQCA